MSWSLLCALMAGGSGVLAPVFDDNMINDCFQLNIPLLFNWPYKLQFPVIFKVKSIACSQVPCLEWVVLNW